MVVHERTIIIITEKTHQFFGKYTTQTAKIVIAKRLACVSLVSLVNKHTEGPRKISRKRKAKLKSEKTIGKNRPINQLQTFEAHK